MTDHVFNLREIFGDWLVCKGHRDIYVESRMNKTEEEKERELPLMTSI